jgi:Phospholipase D Active site motif
MLPKLLTALAFGCNNVAYRPVMEALELLRRYADRSRSGTPERVPIHGLVPAARREAVVDEKGRVEQIPYELCVLTALRDAIRRRVNAAGGDVLLDQRVRLGASHHQKVVVIRHAAGSERDVAFVGGIDLCHSRRDECSPSGRPTAPVNGARVWE